MYQLETFNQWTEDSEDFPLIGFVIHRCPTDWGFDLFLLGFGVVIRLQ